MYFKKEKKQGQKNHRMPLDLNHFLNVFFIIFRIVHLN